MSAIARIPVATISIGKMHAGQIAAFRALQGHRLKALRCGRRFGKTDLGKIWIGDGLARGLECGWFAPQHNTWSEVYAATVDTFRPILGQASKSAAVIRMKTGGRLDFWTLGMRSLAAAAAIIASSLMRPLSPRRATTRWTIQ
jgi:hypothetical protein